MSYVNIQGRRLPFVFRYVIDLFTYRHLLGNLVGSDLRSRFRRSYFGILWAVLQPLGFALALAYVWGTLFNIPNYWDFAVYVFAGMIVWEYFSNSVITSQDALTNAEGYLKQTRIPFLVFQLRAALTGLVILFAGFCGLLTFQAVLGKAPLTAAWAMQTPMVFGLLFLFMAPICIIMSVLGTQMRDLKHLSNLLVSALFLLSPVMLDRSAFDNERLAFLVLLNPMIGVLDLFRTAVVDGAAWTVEQIAVMGGWIAGLWTAAIALAIQSGRRLVYAV